MHIIQTTSWDMEMSLRAVDIRKTRRLALARSLIVSGPSIISNELFHDMSRTM